MVSAKLILTNRFFAAILVWVLWDGCDSAVHGETTGVHHCHCLDPILWDEGQAMKLIELTLSQRLSRLRFVGRNCMGMG